MCREGNVPYRRSGSGSGVKGPSCPGESPGAGDSWQPQSANIKKKLNKEVFEKT